MTQGVIEFIGVSKTYQGATIPAVRDLNLRIEAGEICALVGPSGSGKTTAMRMINRLIEPTSGDIKINGASTRSLGTESLRRQIGYVIQQVGLFPHRTIFDNVATVPRMLGWDESRIGVRVRELIEMVGLDPAVHAQRYPAQLSGGQRQRIGVARALAADPPVMLMDEPFGAIDPVVRGKIQDEFLRLQQQVKKTIVIVTHDIDEAIKMGDKIAVLKEGGVLAQYGTPSELLAHPNSDFVAQFIGTDSGLKRLSLNTVAEAPLIPLDVAAAQGYSLFVDAEGRPQHWGGGSAAFPQIRLDQTLRDALSEMFVAAVYFAPVVDEYGRAIAVVSMDVIQTALRMQSAPPNVAALAS